MNNSKKTSIDFSPKSIELMEKAKIENYDSRFKISNSFLINQILENILGCPAPLKKEIIKSLYSLLGYYHLQRLTSTRDKTFLDESLLEVEKCLQNLIEIFGGQNSERLLVSDHRRLIHMSGGRSIRIPSDWIVINENEAQEFTDAFVLECTNTTYYGLPHFLMFYDNRAYDNLDKSAYSKQFENLFYESVLQVYPNFQVVLDNQVDTKRVDGDIQDLDAWSKAPLIGIFRIKDSYDLEKRRKIEKDYVPPMGIYVNVSE